ncbi:MAG TPA: hypothetical protein VGD98_22690 [Ktedonobacteraceae bacterium]
MNLYQQPPGDVAVSTSSIPARQGQGHWPQATRVIWLVLACGSLVIFVANIPAFFQYASTVCTLSDAGNCPAEQLTPAYARLFESVHLSVGIAGGLLAAFCIGISVVYWLLGLLIFWRKSHELIGWLVSLLLILFASTGLLGFNLPTQTLPPFQLLTEIICYGLMWPAFMVLFFTFPTGRFTPRWTLVVFVPFFVVTMASSLPITVPFVPPFALILANLLAVVVQIYRYARVYNFVQRQQLRWFFFGLGIMFLLVILQNIFQVLLPVAGFAQTWYELFNGPFWLVIWTILILSMSISILRYRLWDIDIIINRALVYGFLTVLLVALYVGLILTFSALLRAVIGSPSEQPIVIVASTLIVAALFQPLRRGLQTLIDRRFYRSKYDSARVIAGFSSTLHSEIDLEQLCEQLLGVVQETMQPSRVSLWVCPPRRAALQSVSSAPLAAEGQPELGGYEPL